MLRIMVLLLAACAAVCPATSAAHSVNLFAYREGGSVITEAYFMDGTPCRNAQVTVYGNSGAVISEGVTDDEGRHTFTVADQGDLRIVARAGMGHGAQAVLIRKEPTNPETLIENASDVVDGELDRIVEAKIAPIRESLGRIERRMQRPGPAQVLGGIGWIVGLAGAYLWGVSRRRP